MIQQSGREARVDYLKSMDSFVRVAKAGSFSAAAAETRMSRASMTKNVAAKTVDFLSRVLGMKFVSTVMDDKVPSTGEAFPYRHLFFEMKDGSTLAFFVSPSLPERAAASRTAYKVFDHMALQAASSAEVDAWAQRLRDNGGRRARSGGPRHHLQHLFP